MTATPKPGSVRLPPHVVRRELQPGPPVWVELKSCWTHESAGRVNIAPIEESYECRRCGARQQIVFPIMGQDWIAAANAFGELHRSCR